MKDAYYFPHDSNAQHDEKILQLRSKFGWEGYGLYWAIIEKLRDSYDYNLKMASIPGIALSLSHPQATLDEMLNLCFEIGLLSKTNDSFYSESLSRRMHMIDEKRERFREFGRIGGKISSQARATLKLPSSSKVKESKVKNTTPNKEFEVFYQEYPKKKARVEAEKAFKRLSPSSAVFEEIIAGVKKAKLSKDWQKDGGQFIPLPATYLNQRRWEDEIIGKKAEDEWK